VNDIAYKFCPKCGCNKDQWKPPSKSEENSKEKEEGVGVVLQRMSVINDGVYKPNEERQTGWIVQNCCNKEIDVMAQLVKIGGDSNLHVTFEKSQRFQLKPKEESFIMIGVKAPRMPKNYHLFCQLIAIETGEKICDILELKVCVQSQFGQQKEGKIEQILKMGFSDREKIITALKKWNWDELKAINWLATH